MSKKTGVITIKFNERDMLFRQVESRTPTGKPNTRFYVARHFGSRDIWIEAKFLRPHVRSAARKTVGVLREVDVHGCIIEVVAVEWILTRFNVDAETARFFVAMEDAFDSGAVDGKCIHNY